MLRCFLIISFAFLVSSGCKKDPPIWQINNLNGNKISAFGHGGLGIKSKYPMNSMESLNKVLALGADGTEMDVQLTKDNVLVLYHSPELGDGTSCDGKIRNMSWSELEGCRYKQPLFDKARLIRAEDFFNQVSDKQLIFTFDSKVEAAEDQDFLNRFSDALVALIQKHQIVENSFIESYNSVFLRSLYDREPRLRLFVHSSNLQDGLSVSKEVKLYGITIDREYISRDEIVVAHNNGLRVTLFNADTEKENLEAIQMSPDFIQTDKMEKLLGFLRN